MLKQRFYIAIMLTILILLLTGCTNNNKDDEESLNEKVNSEINYMDSELISIMSKLNNINFTNYMVETRKVDASSDSSGKSSTSSRENSQNSQSSGTDGESEKTNQSSDEESGSSEKNKEEINITEMVANSTLNTDYDNVKWEEISNILETFCTSWNTIILDLYKLNINSTDITDFSKNLDNLLVNIKNKDKAASLSSASILYSYIPKYIESYSSDTAFKDLITTKLYILNAYVGATIQDWNYSNNQLELAVSSFSNVMKNAEIMKEKEYNINKTYVTLKELQSSTQNEDTSIFFLKFKNLMQEIEIL